MKELISVNVMPANEAWSTVLFGEDRCLRLPFAERAKAEEIAGALARFFDIPLVH